MLKIMSKMVSSIKTNLFQLQAYVSKQIFKQKKKFKPIETN